MSPSMARPSLPLFAALVLAILARVALAAEPKDMPYHRVKDGPGAEQIRESLRIFEQGEDATDEDEKIRHYTRGKELAARVLEQHEASADAHFAYFSNWGRILQTQGWLKNVHNMPALQKHLDRTLELDPDHTDALAAQGGLYRQLPRWLGGNEKKAEEFLKRSIANNPRAVGARLELAELYIDQDREKEAAALVREAYDLARDQRKARAIRKSEKLFADLGVSPSAKLVDRR